MLEIQRELDVANEDLVAKNKDFDESRGQVDRLRDRVT